MRRRLWAVPLAVLLTLSLSGLSTAHELHPQHRAHSLGDGVMDTPLEADQEQARLEDPDEQHGGSGGHLPASSLNVDLVGQLTVPGAHPGHIADVTVLGEHAYLAGRTTSPCSPGKVHIVDISSPSSPSYVGAVTFPAGSYPGEGMQALRLNTPAFKGDILVTNNENCGSSTARVGGMSIYDITDPRNVTPLAIGKGDTNGGTLVRARSIHSVFAWQAGKKAYAIMVDNEEITDVDFMDITNPANPVLITETSILDWPGAQAPLANGERIFLHDMVVKSINGHYLALLSYWDAGWVVLNVDDPANPVFVTDSDHPDPEPLLGFSPPEGNAHQAEWSHNNKYIIGTDEDFSPGRIDFQMTTGPHAGFYGAGEFSWTVPIATKFASNGGVLQGPTVWGGSGCIEDVNGNGTSDRAEVPPASSIPAAAGEVKVIVFGRGSLVPGPTCFFSHKVESGQLAGYDAVIVGDSHVGSRAGLVPNSFLCGAQGHTFTITAAGLCLGHRGMHLLFDDTPAYTPAEGASGFQVGGDMPALGTIGAKVRAESTFDGWGAIHLLNGKTLEEIDAYSIPEAIDPAHAVGSGTMSVHEVAMDKAENLGYLSWYDAGIRVVRFGPSGITEVGHYIASGGNDFWGIEAHRLPDDPTEQTYILGSDRDSGLWIFRYTGP